MINDFSKYDDKALANLVWVWRFCLISAVVITAVLYFALSDVLSSKMALIVAFIIGFVDFTICLFLLKCAKREQAIREVEHMNREG